MPKVTVLMPLFNEERHAAAAIESILRQTYRDFELMMIDDGSTDRSKEIAEAHRDPRVRVLVNERNIGLAASLNRGLAEARGELIARQDADDLSEPDRLERQVAIMDAQPDLALLGCQAHAIDESGTRLKPVDRPIEPASIRWYGLFDNPFVHTSVMFRRAAVCDGRFRGYPQIAYAEDYALWSALMRDHRVGNLPDRLVTFRVRPASKMGSIEAMPTDRVQATGFPDIVRALVGENLAAAFGPLVSNDDAALMSGFVLGVARDELERFLGVFHRLLGLYVSRDAGFRRTADFDRTLARQFDAIAYRVMPPGRAASLRVYRSALQFAPDIARRMSWLRAASLVVFGREGRSWFNRLRRYSQASA